MSSFYVLIHSLSTILSKIGARISFEPNSVSGILLFRALSQVLVVFTPRLLALSSSGNPYEEK
jgi:hypothetical protein